MSSTRSLSFIPPQTPMLVESPPEGAGWMHEVKFDGFRTQLIIERGRARALTRNGHDWSQRYAPVVQQATALPAKSAILDGEMVVLDERGASDMEAFRDAMRFSPDRLVFVAFDLLHLDGRDMRKLPLIERRAALWNLVKPGEGKIQFSHALEADGAACLKAVDGMGLEGIVSKRLDSPYYGRGKSQTWRKSKCFAEGEFDVLGVLVERGAAPLALMASRDDHRCVGSAIINLGRAQKERLVKRVQEKPGEAPKGVRKPAAHWVQPGLVGSVRYLKGEQTLRHATLRDLREE